MTAETQGVRGWKVIVAEGDVADSPGSLALRGLGHNRVSGFEI